MWRAVPGVTRTPILVLLIGWSPGTALAQTRLDGYVLQADGATPINCATLELRDGAGLVRTASPDTAGFYEFASVIGGFHRLTVHAPDFLRQSVPFFVAPGTVRLDFLLVSQSAPVTVQGRVLKFERDTPVSGAFVEVLDGDTVLDETYSCAAGSFEAVLPADATRETVTVRVSAPGADTAVTTANLPSVVPLVFHLVFGKESGKDCQVLGCGDYAGPVRSALRGDTLVAFLAACTCLKGRRRHGLR